MGVSNHCWYADFCFVVLLLFSFFSIFFIKLFGDHIRLKHQETIREIKMLLLSNSLVFYFNF